MLKITILSLFAALAINTVHAVDPKIHIYFGPSITVGGNGGKIVAGPNSVEHVVDSKFLSGVNFSVEIKTEKVAAVRYMCNVDVKDKNLMKEDRVMAFQSVEPYIPYGDNGPVVLKCNSVKNWPA